MASPYWTFNPYNISIHFSCCEWSNGRSPENETSQLASSPMASAQTQDSVIVSYKELINEQVNIFKLQIFQV
jgi:hypothetical protein